MGIAWKVTVLAPGIHWASRGISALITVAILGYPPVVWWSAIITIGCLSAGTWTEPNTMPSDMRSARPLWAMAAPWRR